MNLNHATLVHWAEPGQRALCLVAGPTTYDEPEVTCKECLFHLLNGILEDEGMTLEALEIARLMASLEYPDYTIAVVVTGN